MKEIILQAKKRDVIGKQVKSIRREGELPGIVYGPRIQPINITLNYREASRILPYITSSHLVIVDVEGDRHNVLVREKQRHPYLGTLLHVDFMAVSLTEKLRAGVLIEFEGESPAVKELGGILVTGQEEIEVECLPQDLPERITINLSVLREIGDAIHVKDLIIPDNVQVLTALDEMVALVTAPAVEEVEEVVEEVVEEEAAEPEVIEHGKKEEEEEF